MNLIEAASGAVLHVVCWSLPANHAGREAVHDLETAARALASVPGVTSVRFGPRYQTPWPGPDDGFDCAMAIVFESPDVIAAFIEHPAHIAITDLTGRLGASVSAFYAGTTFCTA